jgi:hypothetical protein
VTESISPRSYQSPQIRYQPSMLSVPSAANTIAPDEKAPISLQGAQKPTAWRKLWFFTAVSALVGTAAAGALSRVPSLSPHIHSGSPGFKKTAAGHELLWKQTRVTVYLDDSLVKLGPQANDAVVQAFGQWLGSDSKLPAVIFDTRHGQAEPKQDGKNTVSYAPITAPGHERDVAITITYANDKTGEIVEADVILNAHYPMGVLTPRAHGPGDAKGGPTPGGEAMDCENRYDAQNVATHEAGHFFGLGEDMTERSSTMFLSIDECETHKRVLSSTDVGAVTTLYAASEAPEPGGANGAGCSFGGAPAGGGALAMLGLVFGLGRLRRRAPR